MIDRRTTDSDSAAQRDRTYALILLFIVPALFSTNIIVARAVNDTVPPFALAYWRWMLAFLLFLPVVGPELWRHRAAIVDEWRDLLVLGILGIGICGAFVYIGAATTSATNIGLIFGSAPIIIAGTATLMYGEPMVRAKAAGIFISLLGVLIVVFRGDMAAVLALTFVPGDLWIAAAALAWAIYSVMLRHRPGQLPARVRFSATMLFGALSLLPFYIVESAQGVLPSLSVETVGAMLVVAIVPGLAAYIGYARIQRSLGAGSTGLILYLAPTYTALFGWVLLGETLEPYHFAGAALILPGIFLSTRR
ncbi:MAG: EamA family transporter [Alphaproteobacteria bacterium]|nr:EamA family transporter [Alphaproteobacteria bacterium]